MEEYEQQLPEKELDPGKQWAQRLGVGGGSVVLLFSLVFVLTMLTAGAENLDYTPAQTDAHYAEHLDVLEADLPVYVLPELEGVQDCAVQDGKLVIGIRSKHFIETRAQIIELFDRDLFVFEER